MEKDVWARWTLDVLFNGLSAGGRRLLFKGGTSLPKAFGLVPLFSEDIDITVFRDDLGRQGMPAYESPEAAGLARRSLPPCLRCLAS